MESGPRLSIGLPVYNGENFLAEALDSILTQTFRDFELVVLDNASTDRTPSIVEAAMCRDARIHYIRNEANIGACPNFTKIATLTRAPLFKWVAHDDLYEPTYLEECVRLLDQHPDVVLAHSDSVLIDDAGHTFRAGSAAGRFIDPTSGLEIAADPVALGESSSALCRFHDVVFNSRLGTHMFGVVRRSALERTGMIQTIPSADRPFLAELALLGAFRQVRAPLFKKRFHKGMTWALSGPQIARYVGGDNTNYRPQLRKLRVYLGTPFGKPVGWPTKLACLGIVTTYSGLVMARNLLRRNQYSSDGVAGRAVFTPTRSSTTLKSGRQVH